MKEQFMNRAKEIIGSASPIIVVTSLLVSGIIFAVIGFIGQVIVQDRQGFYFELWSFVREIGIAIVVAGVIGGVMRVVTMIGLINEMVNSFIFDERILGKRNDLLNGWLRLTRIIYLHDHHSENGELERSVEECLRRSLHHDGALLMKDIHRNLEFDWKRDQQGNSLNDGMGVLIERLYLTAVPLDSKKSGTFKTIYSATDEEDISFSIDIEEFCYDKWNGDEIKFKVKENGPNFSEIEAEIPEERRVFIRRKYEWNVSKDPFIFFVWPNVAKEYTLIVECKPEDVKVFFLAEGAFEDRLDPDKRKRHPGSLHQVCDGILLPGQSHTVSFQKL